MTLAWLWALPAFAAMSLVGRGARFFLVAGLIRWGGEPMAAQIRRPITAPV